MANVAALLCCGMLVMAGCDCAPRGSARATDAAPLNSDVAEGYGLLHDLVSQESDLSKILFLKSASPAVKQLIHDITATSQRATTHLAALPHPMPRMPRIEADAHASISSATSLRLLGTGGDRFEIELLLTQVSATEYASNLASSLAKLESRPEQQTWLRDLAKEYWALNRRVVERLSLKVSEKP